MQNERKITRYFHRLTEDLHWAGLQEKLPGLPDAGLNARKIINCFYPLTYDDWITRQMLNLTNDISCEHLHLRGPPLTVKRLVQQCDLFKVNCVTVHGKP